MQSKSIKCLKKFTDKFTSALKVKLFTSEKDTHNLNTASATRRFDHVSRLLGRWHSRTNGGLTKCLRNFLPVVHFELCLFWTAAGDAFYRLHSQSTGAIKCKGNKTRHSELPIPTNGESTVAMLVLLHSRNLKHVTQRRTEQLNKSKEMSGNLV